MSDSVYWQMWEKLKAASVEERQEFLKEHPRAEGKDLEFRGQTFFDVDLLESMRNSLEH
jgi:2-oxo-4-hydroxy-4-carboxy--5-ureidoimidazoline (OHCU) decarboxylase